MALVLALLLVIQDLKGDNCMLVLGLDPGSRFTGFGLIEVRGEQYRYVDHGVVSIPAHLEFPAKLSFLDQKLRELLIDHRPQFTVVEKIFLGKNPSSAFQLGHVRGVCLMRAHLEGSEVFEYEARKVKKIVTGDGGATKDHVRLVVCNTLGISSDLRLDATDALSLAICHLRAASVKMKLQSAAEAQL